MERGPARAVGQPPQQEDPGSDDVLSAGVDAGELGHPQACISEASVVKMAAYSADPSTSSLLRALASALRARLRRAWPDPKRQ